MQLRPTITSRQQGANGDTKGSTAQPQQHFHFWATRLKDVLLGQAVFPGLTLVFESFGARVAFEVRVYVYVLCGCSMSTAMYYRLLYM